MAWCLVKHRDNFTFLPYLRCISGALFVKFADCASSVWCGCTVHSIVTTLYMRLYKSSKLASSPRNIAAAHIHASFKVISPVPWLKKVTARLTSCVEHVPVSGVS